MHSAVARDASLIRAALPADAFRVSTSTHTAAMMPSAPKVGCDNNR